MFFGNHTYRIDQKGRLVIPPSFRGDLRAGIFLARGLDPCIDLCPRSLWDNLYQEYKAHPLAPSRDRDLALWAFGGAFPGEIDGQGRVLLPGSLREYGNIQEEVVIVGIGSFIQLWNPQRWNNKEEDLRQRVWRLAEEKGEKR